MKSTVFLIVLLLCTGIRAESTESARQQLEAFSEGLLNVQLEFSQVVTSQDGSIQDRAGGQAWLQRPDRMRWVYQGDFPEVIVADGRNVWIYDESGGAAKVVAADIEGSNGVVHAVSKVLLPK